MLFDHETVVVEPDLFIPILGVVSFKFGVGNRSAHDRLIVEDVFYSDILFVLFFVDEDIGVLARSKAAPFISYPRSSIALFIKRHRGKQGSSGVIVLDPVAVSLDDSVIVSDIRST